MARVTGTASARDYVHRGTHAEQSDCPPHGVRELSSQAVACTAGKLYAEFPHTSVEQACWQLRFHDQTIERQQIAQVGQPGGLRNGVEHLTDVRGAHPVNVVHGDHNGMRGCPQSRCQPAPRQPFPEGLRPSRDFVLEAFR